MDMIIVDHGFSVTGLVFSIVTILNTRNKVNQKK